MFRKIVGIALCLTAIITRSGAQELGIELNGGLQGTRSRLQNGQYKQLPGGSLGLSYIFSLNCRWGLRTGIIGGIYRTQATLRDGVVFTSDQVDDAGSAFQYNVKTEGYKEIQRFFVASIPLLLQYHTVGSRQWYFEAGGKVLVPFNTSIQVSAQQLTLSGYYPDFNLDVSNLPQHGFGALNNWKGSTTSKLKPGVALSAATGLSFILSPGTRLYTGLFGDFSISDLKDKNGNMPLLTYSPTGINGVKANSVLNMQNGGQVTLLSFGLQVRIGFGSTKVKPAAQPKTKEEPQQHSKPILSDEDAEVIRRPVIFGIFGEISIPEMEKPQLNAVANILKQYPHIRISIVGHFCNSGTEKENIKVGAARAKAVAHYLGGKGIDPSRMNITSVSESDPVQPSDPAANYRNRRVVITVE